MKSVLLKSQVLISVLVILHSAGCCPPQVEVAATGEICKKSVEVHLVGVNRYEKNRWETVSMTDYWAPGNQLRKSAAEQGYARVVQFGKGPCVITLGKKDPIWDTWDSKKATHLFVLADLPGIFDDLPANADARRLSLPLDCRCWKGKKGIQISIEPSNVVPLTMPKEKCE